jgi:hypothetical protein
MAFTEFFDAFVWGVWILDNLFYHYFPWISFISHLPGV